MVQTSEEQGLNAMLAVRPTPRQLAWQQLGMYAFLHFGMSTMTDREWGLGHEDPTLFDPDDLDADEWMKALAGAGMRGVILTAKHHDGFCLWPSRLTSHTVASSPWRGGRGDLVAEVADAARRAGLRFGVYLSPWDRTEPSYGSGTGYDDFYVGQLTELLTGYGEIFEVWLDGANGEGENGRRQLYDWDRYYQVVRELQPGAVIAVCGPDVRWCGNEAGHTRADEWSVVPGSLRDAERIASRSQTVDDGDFARRVTSDEEDLGSRAALAGHLDHLVWYPSEVNTSIRPGWFHHPSEDDRVRDADELFSLYRGSVGGNASFLLNVPPDRHGRIGAPDREALAGLGERIASFQARTVRGRASASSGAVTPGEGVLWRADASDLRPTLTLDLGAPTWIEAVEIGEAIAEGQRIERVVVTGRRGGETIDLGETGCVGNRRILDVEPAKVDAVEFTVTGMRGAPLIADAAVITAL
jgi:alpha-L-fucosidase